MSVDGLLLCGSVSFGNWLLSRDGNLYLCVLSGQDMESHDHLFFECLYSAKVCLEIFGLPFLGHPESLLWSRLEKAATSFVGLEQVACRRHLLGKNC